MADPSGTGDKQQLPEDLQGMEQEAKLLAGFLDIPSISKGWLQPASSDGTLLTVQFSQRNLPANAQRKYTSSLYLPAAFSGIPKPLPSFPTEVRDVGLISWSPSGRKGLVSRAGTEGNSASLEIWGSGRLLKQVNVPKALHGSIYNDGWFASGAAWSPDESAVAYVAEAPAGRQMPQWPSKPPGKDDSKDGAEPPKNAATPATFKGVGEFEEDWGELNAGKRAPAIFVLDLAAFTVRHAAGLPADTSAGQPVWTPDGKELVVTVWSHDFPQFGRRLGIVYCMNRPCSLYRLPAPSDTDQAAASAQQLTPGDSSAMSARFSPDGTRLAYVSHRAAVASGTHGATAALDVLHWPPSGTGLAQTETVIDVVDRPESEQAFPGLYLNALAEQPFIGDSTLLLTTQWRSSTDIVAVDLDRRSVQRLRPEGSRGSWSLLAIGSGWVAAVQSAPNQPHQLQLGRIADGQHTKPWAWHAVETTPISSLSPEVAQHLQQLQFETIKVKPTRGPQDLECEAIVVRGQTDKPAPGLLFPHGGPHSTYPDGFWPSLAFLSALGYTIILVNFRGSLGFGEANVRSLPGNVGDHDVTDCIASLDAAIARGWLDESRLAVMGGSHGGLLTGHLVGQYPQRFKCGVLRNPVMDISAMIYVSDIPDWCYVESWGVEEAKQRVKARPDQEDLQCFLAHSPMAHIDKVTVPLCFMLGAKDKRVIMQDAKLYVGSLRSRGKDGPTVRTIVFPEDTHALDRPQTEFESLVTHAWWFKQYVLQQEHSNI